jgi:hypothetical protein
MASSAKDKMLLIVRSSHSCLLLAFCLENVALDAGVPNV